MRFVFSVCMLLCLSIAPFTAVAAEVANLNKCIIEIIGEFDKLTPTQVERALSTCPGGFRSVPSVKFHSAGGDVRSALSVGRIIRKAGAFTVIPVGNSCASACVLAFLGGVNRFVGGQIGLHRAFPASSSATPKEAHANRTEIDRLIREYLVGMNIPDRLLFEMNAVSPGSIRWLSEEEELRQLQITGEDPLYGDERDAYIARYLGISMSEYYARMQKVNTLCELSGMRLQEAQEYAKCKNDILEGKR